MSIRKKEAKWHKYTCFFIHFDSLIIFFKEIPLVWANLNFGFIGRSHLMELGFLIGLIYLCNHVLRFKGYSLKLALGGMTTVLPRYIGISILDTWRPILFEVDPFYDLESLCRMQMVKICKGSWQKMYLLIWGAQGSDYHLYFLKNWIWACCILHENEMQIYSLDCTFYFC